MPHLPDFEAWAIFAKVAERGSFSAAATELGLSKTTVSKVITRLEERMRTTLIHRTTRHLSLTETGRMSLTRATRIMQDGAAIEEDITEEAAAPRGALKLAVTVAFGVKVLGPILPNFLKLNPEVSIDLHLTDDRIDMLRDGFDLAIRIGAVSEASLLISRLFSFRVPLVASPAYFSQHGRPEHPRDLEHHEALVYSHIANAAEWPLTHASGERYTARVKGRILINNGVAAVPALVAGLGLTLQPEAYIWQELQDGRLEEALTEWSHPATPVYMLTPPRRVRPARVRAFMEHLRQEIRKAPWGHGIQI